LRGERGAGLACRTLFTLALEDDEVAACADWIGARLAVKPVSNMTPLSAAPDSNVAMVFNPVPRSVGASVGDR
jgi:hypothetical protein